MEDHVNESLTWFLLKNQRCSQPTTDELQAVDELDLFGCVEVKVSEGGISGESEALEVVYGLHQPGVQRQGGKQSQQKVSDSAG